MFVIVPIPIPLPHVSAPSQSAEILEAPKPRLIKGQEVSDPGWAVKPTRSSLETEYPEKARRISLSGDVFIQCAVNVSGGAERCAVLSESPEGYGFGDAALRIVSTVRFWPKTVDGQPVEGLVKFPIQFHTFKLKKTTPPLQAIP